MYSITCSVELILVHSLAFMHVHSIDARVYVIVSILSDCERSE